jgi:hypothetical protein
MCFRLSGVSRRVGVCGAAAPPGWGLVTMGLSWSDAVIAIVLGGLLLLGWAIAAAGWQQEPRGDPSATVVGPARPAAAHPGLVLAPRAQFRARYDRDRDVFLLRLAPDRPTASYKRVGAVWVRAVPTTGEILGFEIEEFVSGFLPGHPALQRRWRRPVLRARLGVVRRWAREMFLRALLADLRQDLDAASVLSPRPQDAASP